MLSNEVGFHICNRDKVTHYNKLGTIFLAIDFELSLTIHKYYKQL